MLSFTASLAPTMVAAAPVALRAVPDWAKGNYFYELFFKGGPVMYAIVLVLVVAIALILERAVWWTLFGSRRDVSKLDKVYTALEQGNIPAATNMAKGGKDPLTRTVWHGLEHTHASVEGALQVASGVELQRAGRFMWLMDSVITLAPLLGLLGTVTGIMSAFNAVNEGGLSPAAVSGGIGEALIATAFGLGIAIATLIFFNFFNAKLQKLQFELETTMNNILIMMNAIGRKNNLDVVPEDARQPQQFASSN